jgi:hypothetical protein
MTMPREDHELLSAYLAGELDDAAAAAFEARLTAEPALAARLEALHDALVRLQGLDDVAPPDGFGARLRERLAAEADVPAAAATERAAGAVVDIGVERTRRRGLPWAPLGAVAAGVATLAVIVAVVGPPGAMEDAAAPDEAAEAPAADATDDEAVMEFSDDADLETLAVPRAQTDSPAEAFAPLILDSEVVLADEATARERYTGLDEAQSLLGMPRAEAEDRAASARFAVQRSASFASGVRPDQCLDVVSAAADGPVVVARVESAFYEGVDALVYLAVTASAGSLDRVEVWVIDPDTCATRLFLTVA